VSGAKEKKTSFETKKIAHMSQDRAYVKGILRIAKGPFVESDNISKRHFPQEGTQDKMGPTKQVRSEKESLKYLRKKRKHTVERR